MEEDIEGERAVIQSSFISIQRSFLREINARRS